MRYSIIVTGKVQRVFFRHAAKNMADKLHVTGWVKNKPDGTVEIEASGSEQSVQRFIGWCKKGPLLAHVRQVLVCPLADGPSTFSFDVLR